MFLSYLIYTVRQCLIHTSHATPMPCSDHAVLLKATVRHCTARHGRLSTDVLCCGLEKNGKFRAWYVCGMASVNQKRPHCVNQMGKKHSKHLAAQHGRGTAWTRHAMCESVFKLSLLKPAALDFVQNVAASDLVVSVVWRTHSTICFHRYLSSFGVCVENDLVQQL